MNQIDYKKVFSKLSHIKALSHDQKFDQIVQNLITHALNQIDQPNPKNEIDVEKRVKDLYGISIRNKIIISNLDKLISKGDVIKDPSTKEYFVSNLISNNLTERLKKANDLENEVQKKWFEELKILNSSINEEDLIQLWNLLKEYLSNVFEQHGVQTLNFLNPQIKINEDDQKNLTTIVETILDKYKNFSKEIVISSINQFIINADEKRAKYISQLADATFTSFALTSDAETVNFLNKRYQSLILFLDTNFIFGVLDLHKNSEDGSAIEILEEVKKNNLPFKLTYHPETLAEFKRAFDARALVLRASKWTRESSRIAVMVDGLSPIEELFHKQNLEIDTDPTVFLEKYDHVDLILKDLGLIEYTPHSRNNNDELYEIEKDVEEYQKFYSNGKHRKNKSFAGFKHDVITLREVRALNPKKTKFLESKAFFISSDFVLGKFERIHYKKNWEINYVVNPSVFLQLIRPFIENDYNANKRFIDTFSIPEFRSFEIDYSTTRSKALQIINDNYHSTSLETKVKILRDQVLLEKLDNANDDYEKQITIIEKQIAVENQILASEKDDALSDSMMKEKQIIGLSGQIENIQKDLQNEKLKNIYFKETEKWKIEKEEFTSKKIKEKREDFRIASKYCLRPMILMIVVVIASPLVIKFYNEIKGYLINHNISETWLIFVIMFFLFIVLIELIYRTFIVDKEKTKMGILWICTLGLKTKKKKLLTPYRKNIEDQFQKLNPEPILKIDK